MIRQTILWSLRVLASLIAVALIVWTMLWLSVISFGWSQNSFVRDWAWLVAICLFPAIAGGVFLTKSMQSWSEDRLFAALLLCLIPVAIMILLGLAVYEQRIG
jgi:hypothetical protein